MCSKLPLFSSKVEMLGTINCFGVMMRDGRDDRRIFLFIIEVIFYFFVNFCQDVAYRCY